jgi:hypothetical protein
MKRFFWFSIVVLLAGCASTSKTKLVNKAKVYPELSAETPVYVLLETELVPYQSELVGGVKIGDSGFSTNCSYVKALASVKDAARKAGANIVKITETIEPDGL